ncbi:hypothetical protein [Shinella sp.]|jgi:nucleotide-binding universal stress UspA family protein|uniref:hypothetical protein n=1 Tax=Shinella sp. TaxID=1870904 RepID=UPI003F7277C1
MNMIANAKPASFFDDIPPRAMLAVQLAWKEIRTPGNVFGSEAVYAGLHSSATQNDVVPPSKSEFLRWFKAVRAGDVPRPGGDELERAASVALDEADRLQWAIAIVCAAHTLFNAKIEAGYSPLSVGVDDTITAEALKVALAAEARELQKVEPLAGGSAEHAARLLLSLGEAEVEQKVLDCLAIDLQQELCASLVRVWIEEGRAA